MSRNPASDAVERARDVAPSERAAVELVLGYEAGTDEAQKRGKGAAVHRRPGDWWRRAGIVLPIRRRLVFVRQEFPQDQQRGLVVLRAFLPGREGDVPRQMRGDDVAAAVAK